MIGSIMNKIVIDFTAPNRAISTNESNRIHWAQRRRHLEPWKEVAHFAYHLMSNRDKEFFNGQKFKCQITIPFDRNARRDPHNYVGTICKTIIDSMTNYGLIPDDTTEYIEVLEPILVVDKSKIVIIKCWRDNE